MFGRWKKQKKVRMPLCRDWVMVLAGERAGAVGRINDTRETPLGRRYHVLFSDGAPEGLFPIERIKLLERAK